MTERAREVALADAGRSGDQHVQTLGDPREVRHLAECSAVEAACGLEVEVFECGVLCELRPSQALSEPTGLTLDELVLDEQAQSVFDRQVVRGECRDLLLERRGHATQSELVQLLEERLGQHRYPSHLGKVTGATHVGVVRDRRGIRRWRLRRQRDQDADGTVVIGSKRQRSAAGLLECDGAEVVREAQDAQ